MSGIARNLTASAARLTGLFGRNFLCSSKQSYSTCWNCLKLSNIPAKFITPVANTQVKFNLYSTQNFKSQLIRYLDDEIAAEQKSQSKLKPIPSQLGGFEVRLNGSDITLVKQTPVETIEINANINLSLKSSEYPQEEMDLPEAEEGESRGLSSMPPFQIEIKRGDTVLRLLCSYADADSESVDYSKDDNESSATEDTFFIDEISIYKGEWQDTNYSVEGQILDEGVYDMLFGVLEEKGITNDFVTELSELYTSYEHASYVGLLRDLKKFVS